MKRNEKGGLVDYDVKDITLADEGNLKIDWAEATMFLAMCRAM